MRESQARAVLALLVAAYPRASWPESTQAVYAGSLQSFDFDRARAAVERTIATSTFPPAIADLRRLIVEDRLGLPGDVEAWEMAVAHADARRDPPRRPCIDCAGTGLDLDREFCEPCRGTGTLGVDLDALPPVPEPIPRVAAFVGGWKEIRQTTEPNRLRREFVDTYRRVRSEEIERESLRLLGANGDSPLVESAIRAIEAPQ